MRNELTLCCVLCGLMLSLLIPGCAADSKGGDSVSPIFGTWTLESIDGESIDKILSMEMQVPDMKISTEGSIAGFGAVNSFNGKLDLEVAKSGVFSSGPFAATRMAGPPEAMELEQRVLGALDKADSFTVNGNDLELLSGDEVLLVYKRTR